MNRLKWTINDLEGSQMSPTKDSLGLPFFFIQEAGLARFLYIMGQEDKMRYLRTHPELTNPIGLCIFKPGAAALGGKPGKEIRP